MSIDAGISNWGTPTGTRENAVYIELAERPGDTFGVPVTDIVGFPGFQDLKGKERAIGGLQLLNPLQTRLVGKNVDLMCFKTSDTAIKPVYKVTKIVIAGSPEAAGSPPPLQGPPPPEKYEPVSSSDFKVTMRYKDMEGTGSRIISATGVELSISGHQIALVDGTFKDGFISTRDYGPIQIQMNNLGNEIQLFLTSTQQKKLKDDLAK